MMPSPFAVPEINLDECTGCADCIPVCPDGALTLVDNRIIISSGTECSYCGECEEACPTSAIFCPYEVVLAEEIA